MDLRDSETMISILMNNRHLFIDHIVKNYSYDYLHGLFTRIDKMSDNNFQLDPNNKYIYRLLSGHYNNNRFTGSAIDWIPSNELIETFVSLINYFKIETLEQINAGMGIVASLIKKQCEHIEITASDPYENENTCNQLGFIPIAHRKMEDFQYYDKLGEKCPEMIITSYWSENKFIDTSDDNFMNCISRLIKSKQHKIIIVVVPRYIKKIHEIIYYSSVNSDYTISSNFVKAFDSYFFLSELFKTHYPSNIIAHVIIKNDIIPKEFDLGGMLDKAILPCSNPIWYTSITKIFFFFMENISEKLIKDIFKKYDFSLSVSQNNFYTSLMSNFTMLVKKDIINFPQYIYSVEEFMFWSERIRKNIYLCFENRFHFFDFYTKCINQQYLNNIPINKINNKYIYIYLESVVPTNEWKKNLKTISETWTNIRNKNKKILINDY